MELEHILKLIDAVSESSLTGFALDDGNFKLTFEADRNNHSVKAKQDGLSANVFHMVSAKDTEKQPNEQIADFEMPNLSTLSAGTVETKEKTEGWSVKSPLVGVYYAAASPEEKPFVQVGDTVKKGQVLGIVEAMKLMNEIESDYDGKVAKILVKDGQMLEYNQPMYVIEPC